LTRLEGGSGSSYTISAALRLRGAVSEAGLRRALVALTGRQAGLRLNIREASGASVGVLRAAYDPLTVVDLRGVGAGEREAAIAAAAARHAAAPFAVDRDALLRLCLLQLDAAEWVLLFAAHHLVLDGWSLAILVRELAALYGGADLAPPAIQYADYAAWQQEWLRGAEL